MVEIFFLFIITTTTTKKNLMQIRKFDLKKIYKLNI